jgi:MFS superfamily sulfate permease-like transporter
MTFSAYLKDVSSYNTHTIRTSALSEISGSLGDLGTLLPLFIALSSSHSIAPASTLVFSGLANIASGLLFGLPIPVQPMKAIAAAAIDGRFDVQRTVAAGVLVSGAVFILAATGTLRWLGRVVPTPVVRGIQVGAGLQLVVSVGQKMVSGMGWVRPRWSDNFVWMIAAFAFLVVCAAVERRQTVVPFALVVTVVGVVLAVLPAHHRNQDEGLRLPVLWHPRVYSFSWSDFRDAMPTAVGQLPLTTLNSILATSHLAAHLLPSRPTPSLGHIGMSLAITNFISAPFGAMPICHGSGGLAGQYRFGARSGASVIFLGTVKLLLGLFAAGPVILVIRRFPNSILGIMVLAAGVELAKVAESVNTSAMDLRGGEGHYRKLDEDERNRRFSVMLVTVAGILAFRNDAVGFLAGLIWHIGVHAEDYWKGKRGWRFSLGNRSQAENEPLIH